MVNGGKNGCVGLLDVTLHNHTGQAASGGLHARCTVVPHTLVFGQLATPPGCKMLPTTAGTPPGIIDIP